MWRKWLPKSGGYSRTIPEALVIGRDTIVALAGEILGKPTSREDGYRMLRLLSGKTHDVYTSVTLKQGKRALRDSSFNRDVLSTDRHGNPCVLRHRRICRQSGAYGIQGQGALLIEAIAGDYYAIMGLPIAKVARLLKEFN